MYPNIPQPIETPESRAKDLQEIRELALMRWEAYQTAQKQLSAFDTQATNWRERMKQDPARQIKRALYEAMVYFLERGKDTLSRHLAEMAKYTLLSFQRWKELGFQKAEASFQADKKIESIEQQLASMPTRLMRQSVEDFERAEQAAWLRVVDEHKRWNTTGSVVREPLFKELADARGVIYPGVHLEELRARKDQAA